MLVVVALICWIAPRIIADRLFQTEEPSLEFWSYLVAVAWIFVLFPLGCVLMITAWRIHRRSAPRASSEEPAGRPEQSLEGGCLSSALPLATIGLFTVFLWANNTRDWRSGLLAAAPAGAAVVVAIRDHRAAQRSGSPRSWDLLALAIGLLTLVWWVAVVLDAHWLVVSGRP